MLILKLLLVLLLDSLFSSYFFSYNSPLLDSFIRNHPKPDKEALKNGKHPHHSNQDGSSISLQIRFPKFKFILFIVKSNNLQKNDTGGIRTHAWKPQWLSRPPP